MYYSISTLEQMRSNSVEVKINKDVLKFNILRQIPHFNTEEPVLKQATDGAWKGGSGKSGARSLLNKLSDKNIEKLLPEIKALPDRREVATIVHELAARRTLVNDDSNDIRKVYAKVVQALGNETQHVIDLCSQVDARNIVAKNVEDDRELYHKMANGNALFIAELFNIGVIDTKTLQAILEKYITLATENSITNGCKLVRGLKECPTLIRGNIRELKLVGEELGGSAKIFSDLI